MNRDTAAVLVALPGAAEAPISLCALANRAGMPEWKVSSALSVLRALHAGAVEERRDRTGLLVRRSPIGDRVTQGTAA